MITIGNMFLVAAAGLLLAGCGRSERPDEVGANRRESGVEDSIADRLTGSTPERMPAPRDEAIFVNLAMQPIHDIYEKEFLDAVGNGMSRVPRMPISPASDTIYSSADGEWRVRNYELIGIAEHDKPVAFTLQGFQTKHQYADFGSSLDETLDLDIAQRPEMAAELELHRAELKELIKDRPLDAFERRAVARLLDGEKAPIMKRAGSPDSYRMVCGIRARARCLKCHSEYREGDALGAFAYWLEKQPKAEIESSPQLFTQGSPGF